MDSPPKKSGIFTAKNASPNDTVENIKTIVIAVIFALLFRSFLYEPFHIPSGSMKSTLLVGDYLFVSKFSYGYSHFSFPFGFPHFNGRILASEPKRGDVVVFRPPGAPDTDYIKRLIGLPGDRIQVKEGVVYINNKPVEREYVDDWLDTQSTPPETLKRFKETLPEGKTYFTLFESPLGPKENTDVYTVPSGHFFMMGDNRDHSADSRYQEEGGKVLFVPEENLIGRADLILFSWACSPVCADRFFLRIP